MRLVATCLAAEVGALEERVRRAAGRLGEADLIEVRWDGLARPPGPATLRALAEAAGGRLLATCRPGGSGSPGSEAERLELLALAARSGAVAVDAELGSEAVALELPESCELIVSHHLPESGEPPTPAEAVRLVGSLRETGAASLKLAAPAGDAAAAVDWMGAARAAGEGRELTLIPLGPAGRGLRLLAGQGWSSLLYCAEGEPAAAGQPNLDDVLDIHAGHEVDESTPVLAVVGWPLNATWSPLLHGAMMRRAGLRGLLVPLPVRDASAVTPVLEELGILGAAVTMPHKRILAGPESPIWIGHRGGGQRFRAPSVKRAGSLNALWLAAGNWTANSFDGAAALSALGGLDALAGRTVAVVGAGGAAAALVAELAAAGIRSVVLARRREAARELAEQLGVEHAALDELAALAADVVVNATPVDPCEPAALRTAFDMRTTPPDTDWLRRAARGQLKAVDGLTMLAAQAAAQLNWWGLPVDEAETEAVLRELVREREGVAG